ncbi:MAG: hypothetical protein KC731_13465, partial [Myxococcales bacterium]|nr:hypothetical protein [Myxococcales bacterium]
MMLLGARLEPAESLPSLAASLASAKWASGLLALATVATLVGGVFLAIGGGRLRLGRGLVLLGGVSWLAHGVLDWLGSPAVVLGMASTIALAA